MQNYLLQVRIPHTEERGAFCSSRLSGPNVALEKNPTSCANLDSVWRQEEVK